MATKRAGRAEQRSLTPDFVRTACLLDYVSQGLSDRAIARIFSEQSGVKITHRDIGRLRRGREPRSSKKRQALGLPVTAPADWKRANKEKLTEIAAWAERAGRAGRAG